MLFRFSCTKDGFEVKIKNEFCTSISTNRDLTITRTNNTQYLQNRYFKPKDLVYLQVWTKIITPTCNTLILFL